MLLYNNSSEIINPKVVRFRISTGTKYTQICEVDKYSCLLSLHMKLQILVIDDDVSILRLLSFILAKDYELIIKNSGLEALAWLEEGNSPALAICDLDMPYIDGKTLIKNLKISGIHRDIPVIILSASDCLAEEVSKMDFAVNGFIQKPFNPVILKTAIANALKIHISAA